MKTKYYLPLLWLCLLTFGSCSTNGDDEPTLPQPEEKPQIEINASQSSPVLEQQGGTATVSFTSTAAWTADVAAATRTASWCSVSPTSGNAGEATLTITTTANETYDERRATVTLRSGTTSKNFTVSQKQKDALIVTSNKIELDNTGGEVVIEVKANVAYQYEIEESAQSWINTVNTRGLTSSTLKLNVAENEDLEKREGTITLRSGELSETVTVYQSGSVPTIVLTQNEYTVGSDGATIQVELRSNIDYEVQLPVEGWITEVETRAFSSHTHHFIVKPNEEYDARTAEITFINKENNVAEKVTVAQMQHDAILIAQGEYTVPAEGGRLDFSINTNVEFTVSCSVDWITQTETRGLEAKALSFTIVENSLDENREGVITLRSGELRQEIRVIQQAKAVFTLSQKEFSVSSEGGNVQVEVTSNNEYTVQLSGDNWITEIETRGAVSHVHTFAIATNETYDARTAEILFTDKATGNVEKVTVTQAQRDAILIAQDEYTVPAEGGRLDFSVNTNVEFTVSCSVDWITQVTTRGLVEKPLSFTVTENTSEDAREGVITLVAGELRQEIKMIQQGEKSISGGIDDMPTQEW